jgi:hypothetical protein
MSPSRHRCLLIVPLIAGLGLLTGACAVPLAVTAGSYAADGALYVATDKTSTDHFTSMVSKQDCAFFRVFRGAWICRERNGDHDPYDVDYDEAHRSPSEDGLQYGSPLRAPPDAPAASWDAAAYKPTSPAPASPEPEPEPEKVVADAVPALQPAAAVASPPPATPKKGKTGRVLRKSSRGQAAPAP